MKQVLFVVSIVMMGGMLVGCGSTSQSISGSTPQQNLSGADTMQNRRPQRAIDIQGTVKSLVGNEVTVNAIDTSSNPLLSLSQQEMRDKMQNLPEEERQNFFQEIQTARENAKTYDVTVLIPAGIPIAVRNFGNRPGGQGGPGGFGGARPGGQAGSQGLAGVFGNSNGSGNRQAGNMPQMAATGTIEDIKVGSSLSVWLMSGSSDRKIAERVSVSQGGTPGAGGFGGQGQGGQGNQGGQGGRPPF